jgi:UDP-N-acetylglucosamine 2-epimerase (non-hydrolysing)
MDVFNRIAKDLPVLFPIHPRTLSQLDSVTICPGQYTGASQVYFVEPVGYLDCIALQQHAVAVITDSGGMQEETTYLGVPCFTLRSNTERPITLEVGTNELIGDLVELLPDKISAITKGFRKSCSIPPLWDGNAATRIAHVMTRNVC